MQLSHKKNIVFTYLIIGMALLPFHLIQAQTMYVGEINETQTSFALNNLRSLSFLSGNIHIQQTDNTTETYAVSELKYLTFSTITTSIDEHHKMVGTSNLIIYPNPVINKLTIELTGSENKNGILRILSLEGKELLAQKTTSTGIIILNLGHLTQGIYLCRYSNGAVLKTEKIIKL